MILYSTNYKKWTIISMISTKIYSLWVYNYKKQKSNLQFIYQVDQLTRSLKDHYIKKEISQNNKETNNMNTTKKMHKPLNHFNSLVPILNSICFFCLESTTLKLQLRQNQNDWNKNSPAISWISSSSNFKQAEWNIELHLGQICFFWFPIINFWHFRHFSVMIKFTVKVLCYLE
jgi:hypothetical protein